MAGLAANMQDMAGAGQMMQQQMRKGSHPQLQQIVYQNLVQHTQPFTSLCWQSNVTVLDRLGKTMNLITNIALAMNGYDHLKAAEFGCNFERTVFHESPTKEAYEREMTNKIVEFYTQREADGTNITNDNAIAQAQAQAVMQMQMGRGMGQDPQQGFQPGQMPQQQQQRPFPQEMARLSAQDKAKVAELATKIMTSDTGEQRKAIRMQLSKGLTPAQLAEFQAQGKDPLIWFYQNHAFQILKNHTVRLQQQAVNGSQGGSDFGSFTPNTESIKDQQMPNKQAQPPGRSSGQELSKMNTLRQPSYTISEDCTEEMKFHKKQLIALKGLAKQRQKRSEPPEPRLRKRARLGDYDGGVSSPRNFGGNTTHQEKFIQSFALDCMTEEPIHGQVNTRPGDSGQSYGLQTPGIGQFPMRASPRAARLQLPGSPNVPLMMQVPGPHSPTPSQTPSPVRSSCSTPDDVDYASVSEEDEEEATTSNRSPRHRDSIVYEALNDRVRRGGGRPSRSLERRAWVSSESQRMNKYPVVSGKQLTRPPSRSIGKTVGMPSVKEQLGNFKELRHVSLALTKSAFLGARAR